MQIQLLYSLLAIGAAFASPIEATAQGSIMRRGEPYTTCVASAMADRLSTAAEEVPKATDGLG